MKIGGESLVRSLDWSFIRSLEHDQAVRQLESCEQCRRQFGPLHALRRGGRDDITLANDSIDGAHLDVHRTQRRRDAAEEKVGVETAAFRDRQAWDATHGWQTGRVAEIDDTLDHHWAAAVLRAVRADEPLAFGIGALRHAAAICHADLDAITKTLPADPRRDLKTAEDTRRQQRRAMQTAARELARAETTLDLAGERRWGRRDKPAIETAERQVGFAGRKVESARARLDRADVELAKARRAVREWSEAMTATAPDRVRLGAAIEDIDAALIHTRPDRIRAALADPTHDVWATLGPPPRTTGGLAAWCGTAEQLEAWNDLPPTSDQRIDQLHNEPTHAVLGRRPGRAGREDWNHLTVRLDNHDAIMSSAERLDPRVASAPPGPEAWRSTTDIAVDSLVERRAVAVDRTIDFGLGL